SVISTPWIVSVTGRTSVTGTGGRAGWVCWVVGVVVVEHAAKVNSSKAIAIFRIILLRKARRFYSECGGPSPPFTRALKCSRVAKLKRRGGSKNASRSRQRRRNVRERAPAFQTEMREVGDPLRIEKAAALREAEHETEEKSDCRAQE